MKVTDSKDLDKEDELLVHAILNQIEADFGDRDFDAIDGMLTLLVQNEQAQEILLNYLGDTCRENLIEGRTYCRY